MANYIDSKGQSITIITLGGAVSTVLLQSRSTTHDVDFFGTNLDNQQRRLLGAAAKYAENHSHSPLGRDWFNNHTMVLLPADVHERITREALQQDEVVFEQRGLKVIAATWNYALCAKMDCLSKPYSDRPHDLHDAVVYLHSHIQKQGGPVRVAQIKEWCRTYRKETSDNVISQVNTAYKQKHKTDGILP